MVGTTCTKEFLNNTLFKIVKILNDNNINNWFVSYGTLLGIIRENGCIEGDDDIDIIIDINCTNQLLKVLKDNDFKIDDLRNHGQIIPSHKNIIKTQANNQFASIDFYMSYIDNQYNYNDHWNKVIWSNCHDNHNKLIPYKWNDLTIFIPHNYENKLISTQ